MLEEASQDQEADRSRSSSRVFPRTQVYLPPGQPRGHAEQREREDKSARGWTAWLQAANLTRTLCADPAVTVSRIVSEYRSVCDISWLCLDNRTSFSSGIGHHPSCAPLFRHSKRLLGFSRRTTRSTRRVHRAGDLLIGERFSGEHSGW